MDHAEFSKQWRQTLGHKGSGKLEDYVRGWREYQAIAKDDAVTFKDYVMKLPDSQQREVRRLVDERRGQ